MQGAAKGERAIDASFRAFVPNVCHMVIMGTVGVQEQPRKRKQKMLWREEEA